jgi:hypothetical protein
MKQMTVGKTSVSGLAHMAHHQSMDRFHGNIGDMHMNKASSYPYGSRSHEFHNSVAFARLETANEHHKQKNKTVSIVDKKMGKPGGKRNHG